MSASSESYTTSVSPTHILHDVEKAIVDIWMICELDLDLVQIRECILDVEGGLAYARA